MKKPSLFLLILVFISGCASINSVSLTPIPADRRNTVKAEKSKTIFFAFNFDNDFVDEVVSDLKRQCPNGKVTGLLTKDENINYFLYIVWKKQITATGYCVATTSASAAKGRARGTASVDDGVSEQEATGL
jgi:hypothetical protein